MSLIFSLFQIARSGPGLIAMAVLGVWLANAVGKWQGSGTVDIVARQYEKRLKAVAHDRDTTLELAAQAQVRATRLASAKRKLELQRDDALEKLDTAEFSKDCTRCRLPDDVIRMLRQAPGTAFGIRGTFH